MIVWGCGWDMSCSGYGCRGGNPIKMVSGRGEGVRIWQKLGGLQNLTVGGVSKKLSIEV